MKDESDAVLVRRVLAGERQAFARLVERYRDPLGRYAVRMLGNAADAEDVLQDTFVRAYRSLTRCRPDDFGRWLFAILVNRCRTHAAQRGRRNGILRANQHVVDAAFVSASDERDALREAIALALERLPAEQREAFLLKHVEELSYQEMHELTGTGIAALRMRVFRAREELRRLLAETIGG